MLKRADVGSIDRFQLPEGCFIDLDWCMGSPRFAADIAAGRLRKAHMLWLLQSNSTVATTEDTALALLLLYADTAPGHQQEGVDSMNVGNVLSCIRWPYVSPLYTPTCPMAPSARPEQLQVRVSRPGSWLLAWPVHNGACLAALWWSRWVWPAHAWQGTSHPAAPSSLAS
jgi:hypothetical protein